MDLSALIFVALAVAWAVYLIPKAIKHHDEVVRSRSVEKFSHTMRVLARREPVDRRNARLVVSPVRAGARPPVETKPRVVPVTVTTAVTTATTTAVTTAPPATSPAAPAPRRTPSPQAERASARLAARRRRRVLAAVVTLNLVVIGLAAGSVVAWPWAAVPATLLVAWLVACRVSVRSERAQRGRPVVEVGAPSDVAPAPARETVTETTGEQVVVVDAVPASTVVADTAASPAATAPEVTTGEIPVVVGGWDMVPTTLPTYVGKPAAQRRTVSTIDLDSTGVWSSGHSDEDSALARSAEQSARAAREADERRSASGA